MGSRCQPWRSMPIQEKRNGGSHGDAEARRTDGEIGRREERRDDDRGNAGRAVLRHGPILTRCAASTREGGRGRLQRQRIPAVPTGFLPADGSRWGPRGEGPYRCGGLGCTQWPRALVHPPGSRFAVASDESGDRKVSRSVTGMMGTGGTRSLPWEGAPAPGAARNGLTRLNPSFLFSLLRVAVSPCEFLLLLRRGRALPFPRVPV